MRIAALLAPAEENSPDEWAKINRIYQEIAGLSGPRNPGLTPYMIPFVRAINAGTHPRVVMAMFAQGGKSDSILDVIDQRLDQRPCPILYLGPTKQFLTEQWEPRIKELFDQSLSLGEKLGPGQTKTRKIVAGVPLRLAHGGSSAALKSDPFGLALTDEADELMANVKVQRKRRH